MDEPKTRPPRRRLGRPAITREIILTLAGLAVVWFSLVSAAAYIIGPVRLCYATLPSDVCRIAFAAL